MEIFRNTAFRMSFLISISGRTEPFLEIRGRLLIFLVHYIKHIIRSEMKEAEARQVLYKNWYHCAKKVVMFVVKLPFH